MIKYKFLKNLIIFILLSMFILISPQFLFSAQIKLAWDPNTEPDLAGYKIYWGRSSRSYENSVDVGNVTQFTLTGLTAGETYFIAATAYDFSNNESGFSNEVSGVAIEPAPVVVITPTISTPETSETVTTSSESSSSSGTSSETSVYVVVSETPSVEGSPIGNLKSYDITSPSDSSSSADDSSSSSGLTNTSNTSSSTDTSNSNTPVVVDSTNTPALDSNGEIKDNATSEWSSQPDGKEITKGGVGEKLVKRNKPRKIYTYLGDANLTATSNSFDISNEKLTSTILGVSESEREKLIQYIHGYDSYGKRDEKGNLKKRIWLLGAITNSRPLVIPYNSKKVIYVGANDGMLHAFDDQTGEELWAFIPHELLPRLKELPQAKGIKYFVDGSPRAYITKNQKVMVFGLRRGGNYYYALDVTNADSPKFLWKIGPEKTGFSELGQTWSNPQFGKLKCGNQTKIACIFGGGYDENHDNKNKTSEDKKGRAVYMVDLYTGEQIWRWDYEKDSNMKYCITSDVARVDLNGDGFIDRLYVGDMGGRLWRFDLRGNDQNKWRGSIVFNSNYNFMGSSKRKIYNKPEVTIEKDGSAIVFFGTGDRENPLDKTSSDKFYSIVDKGQNTILTEDNLTDVTRILGTVENLANKDGWFISLLNNGEKVLSSPVIAFGVIYFTTFTPSQDREGIARLYALNYRTGNPIMNLNRENDVGGPKIDLSDRSRVIGKGIPSGVVISALKRRLIAYTGIQGGLYYTPLRQHSTLIPIWWKEVRRR